MLFVELVNDVKQDRAGFEYSQVSVDESRDFSIGLTFQMFSLTMFSCVFLPVNRWKCGVHTFKTIYSKSTPISSSAIAIFTGLDAGTSSS